MGLKNMIMSHKRRSFAAGSIGVVGAGLAIAGMIAPASGANFSATDTHGQATFSAGSLSLAVGTPSAPMSGSFDLQYANGVPGQDNVQSFTVTNTGTIPADVTANVKPSAFQVPAGSNQHPDLTQLKYYVETYSGWTPVTSTGVLKLGSLGPKSTRTYNVHLELFKSASGDTADNQWQRVTGAAQIAVTLRQQG